MPHFPTHIVPVPVDHGPISMRLLYSVDHYDAVEAVAAIPAVTDEEDNIIEPAKPAVSAEPAHDDPQKNVHVEYTLVDADREAVGAKCTVEVTGELPPAELAAVEKLLKWARTQVTASIA